MWRVWGKHHQTSVRICQFYFQYARNKAPLLKSSLILVVRVLCIHSVPSVFKLYFIFISLSYFYLFVFCYVFVSFSVWFYLVFRSTQSGPHSSAIAFTLWDACWLYFVPHTALQLTHNSLHPEQEIKALLRHKQKCQPCQSCCAIAPCSAPDASQG
jgi:hypothetical protein